VRQPATSLHLRNRWKPNLRLRIVSAAMQSYLYPQDTLLAADLPPGTSDPGVFAQPRMLLTWLSVLAGAVLLLLIPALWNGFPFLFYDSGAFINLATQGGFYPERSTFYAHFIGAFWPTISLWPAMVAQIAITIFVMADFAMVLLPGLSPLRFLLITVALCVCTGLPWKAADVLPDILAPLLVMSLYLLGFHADRLTWPHKAVLVALAVLAATSHASHLGLAAGLTLVVALIQVAMRHKAFISASPCWRLPALVFTLSFFSIVASNVLLTGDVFISRAGPSFIMARLVQDGIAKRVLDDTCPQSGYRLCAFKDRLPADSNDYLWRWDSPFQKFGEFAGMEGESKSIIVQSLKRYPLLNLEMALRDTLEQFVTFKTGDGIEPLNGVPIPALKKHMPDQVALYMASRQRKGEISFEWINMVQMPIAILSISGLVIILIGAGRRGRWDDRVFLSGFVLLALVGNAFICGALSSPHDRYQSRLIWLVCFAVILLLAQQRRYALCRDHLPTTNVPVQRG
jgi:hypothetical protein